MRTKRILRISKSPPFSFHHYSITNTPIHRSVDGHPGNTQDGPSDDLSIRGPTLLGRSDPILRFVRSRQRFVHHCHEWKKAPATEGQGKLSRAELSGLFGPIRSALTGWAERFLVALPTSGDLFV
jgi:hypothetical protein